MLQSRRRNRKSIPHNEGKTGPEACMEKKRLGRGLDALLGGNTSLLDNAMQVPLDLIVPSPHQPRKTFDDEELASLCASVKSHGILQPIVVRHAGDKYQLVAGERRLRAAHDAGLETIPIRIVDLNDQQAYEATLIENIQRTDLNPIEKALGFKDYLDRFKLNHDQLAHRLGLARSTITNLINLLELAPEVQDGVRLNQISEAHAKVLKGVKSKDRQVALFKQIVAMGLSVKATESLVREEKDGPRDEPADDETTAEKPAVEKTAHIKGVEDELRQKLATQVEIRLRAKDQGQIVLHFESNDDFERLLELLRK
ncbi:MAG: ParB/RepB/Spo0J family partition protein [Planctomycetes bacterium]|nr:ParB/RepB/Spo0J family partition protein [Planctomycetota bacterium]